MSSDNNPLSNGTILVPLDVSSINDNNLAYAAELCENQNRSLAVVHAVHEPADNPGLYRSLESGDRPLPMDMIAEKICRRILEKAQRQSPHLTSLVSARLRIVVGQPAQRIAEVAEQAGATLIVMSSSRRNGLRRLLDGTSIPDAVAKKTNIPVLKLELLNEQQAAEKPQHNPIRTRYRARIKGEPIHHAGIAQLTGTA
ncbi:MAG: universal stress protein [Gammaproteobacteria bacterium]|nr:universal stress protein [Gammaproteobacteria bacterium]